jgi:hypothetical protein
MCGKGNENNDLNETQWFYMNNSKWMNSKD